MKSKIHTRNNLIIILCCTIICMAIGYIFLSVELKKEKQEEVEVSVKFTKIERTSSVKSSNKEPKGNINIIDDGMTLDMEFILHATHDELSYEATIENDGTIPIEIINVLESPDYQEAILKKTISPVTITLSDVKGRILSPGESITLKIIAYYAPGSITSETKTIPYKLGLQVKSA